MPGAHAPEHQEHQQPDLHDVPAGFPNPVGRGRALPISDGSTSCTIAYQEYKTDGSKGDAYFVEAAL